MDTEPHFIERELSNMLHAASPPILHAWKSGWTRITFYPNGYSNTDACGCCFTDYPPGWYGYSPKGSWTFICDPHGEGDYSTISWDILESH